MSWKTTITTGLARSLFVQGWAEYEQRQKRTHSGSDLFERAPATPPSALKAARSLIEDTEKLNGETIHASLMMAYGADNKNGLGEPDEEYADDFGKDLGFMVTGTGVSWFDDHAEFKFKWPRCEVQVDKRSGRWSLSTA